MKRSYLLLGLLVAIVGLFLTCEGKKIDTIEDDLQLMIHTLETK